MKIRRRWTALLLATVLCFGVLAACKREQGGQTDSVTLTVWHNADATIADTLQKQADTLGSNIIVKFERKENLSETLKLVGNDPTVRLTCLCGRTIRLVCLPKWGFWHRLLM